VVVRDKKGAILRGLRAADFEVYEDGVRQDVESLDLLERTPPPFVPADRIRLWRRRRPHRPSWRLLSIT
jgi:hypothetical protein